MLNIIYYAWININKNYSVIIGGQLDDIIASGISEVSKLYVIICCEHEECNDHIQNLIHNKLQNKINYELEMKKENHYEYYGIDKLYSLSLQEPNSYFLYFHSKGMFNYDNIHERHIYETTLTKRTLYRCKEVLDLFEKNPQIMKIGLFPSNLHNANFVWFNFYYARGSYLITCEKPIITDYRYYYETWSESGNNNLGFVYNLYENNYRKFSLEEAGAILNMLNGN
jgi:hypothetical protein